MGFRVIELIFFNSCKFLMLFFDNNRALAWPRTTPPTILIPLSTHTSPHQITHFPTSHPYTRSLFYSPQHDSIYSIYTSPYPHLHTQRYSLIHIPILNNTHLPTCPHSTLPTCPHAHTHQHYPLTHMPTLINITHSPTCPHSTLPTYQHSPKNISSKFPSHEQFPWRHQGKQPLKSNRKCSIFSYKKMGNLIINFSRHSCFVSPWNCPSEGVA